MGNALYLYEKAIFTLVKDVGGRLAERVESVDQNETEHMSVRQKKNYYLHNYKDILLRSNTFLVILKQLFFIFLVMLGELQTS